MKSRNTVSDIFASDPKRKVLISCGEIVQQFYNEYNSKIDEIEDTIANNVATQLMAVVLTTLDKSFNFDQKSLEKFMSDMNASFTMMTEDSFWSGKFTPDNCIKYIKDKYDGIDITPMISYSKEKPVLTK